MKTTILILLSFSLFGCVENAASKKDLYDLSKQVEKMAQIQLDLVTAFNEQANAVNAVTRNLIEADRLLLKRIQSNDSDIRALTDGLCRVIRESK